MCLYVVRLGAKCCDVAAHFVGGSKTSLPESRRRGALSSLLLLLLLLLLHGAPVRRQLHAVQACTRKALAIVRQKRAASTVSKAPHLSDQAFPKACQFALIELKAMSEDVTAARIEKAGH